jgi:hypothetical protein
MFIKRHISKKVRDYCSIFPVLALIGPRQAGKTTFVKNFVNYLARPYIYLDLEKPSDLDKLDNAQYYLEGNSDKCVIIDEVQRKPELFPLIRSLVDDSSDTCRFIILGSASPALLKQSSESLAGRIGYVDLGPFSLNEARGIIPEKNLHFRGGFPLAALATNDTAAGIWLDNFIKTYIERDLPALGLKADPLQVRRLWEMLAWQSGSLVNYNMLARSLGISNHTVTAYIDFLEAAFLITRLQPFFHNVKKRLVKSPKIFIRDTGIMHRLLRLESYDQLTGNPLFGHSWETFVINQVRLVKPDALDLYFYRTHAGAEVDLVITKGLVPIALAEVKISTDGRSRRGFRESIETFGTKENFILVPGDEEYRQSNDVMTCGIGIFLNKYLPGLVA